jgi:hypothetical protein
MNFAIYIFLLSVFFITAPKMTFAEKTAVLKGEIFDVKGTSIDGAHVFVYKTPDVKRQPDFVSPRTVNGRYRFALPSGRYWIVARLTKEAYGPLLPGDKHSGEPQEIDLIADVESHFDLTVADFREAAQLRKNTGQDYVNIEGRILDEAGQPVMRAYVVAHRAEKIPGLPDFLSAWTGEDGRYSLLLRRGRYWLGASLLFPPEPGFFLQKELIVDTHEYDLDVILRSSASDKK